MFKKSRSTKAPQTRHEHRPFGGSRTGCEKGLLEEEFATVSYEEMCRTIDRRIESHEEAAEQQSRVRKAAESLKLDDPLGRTAGAYSATESDRLKSNKSGSPDLCSMGGAGRSHGTGHAMSVYVTVVISNWIIKNA